jgi:GNAT superfamily N-acetyltransferase
VRIDLKTEPTSEDIEVIRQGLIASNREASGRVAGYYPFAFHLIDPQSGKPVGGASGHGSFDWVFLELLHVPKQFRGAGHGTRLMQDVERFARDHKLIGIWLDTFSFQARPFYEKLGYTVFGTLKDNPIGGERYLMFKRLDDAPPTH